MPSQMLVVTLAVLLEACCINAYPVYPESNGVQGNKNALREDVPDRLVEDLKSVLWKIATVSELQSQGFTQADQASQQPNKRACFWKYCVTK